MDRICNKKNLDSKEYISILKKIKKAINKIEGNDMYELINESLVNAHYIILAEQFLHEDSVQEEGKEMARKGMLYTDDVAKLAKLFGEYMRESRNK